jgi:hypothetical protein
MSEPEVCVVFEPDATILAVVDVARANRWKEAQRIARGERRLEEVIYELPDGKTVVRGIDDHFVAVVLAAITGPQSEEAERTLRAAGRAVDDTTLWQWAESKDPKERAFALRAFAATSRETVDARVVALYTRALKDQSAEVRKALLEAVGRAAWPELWPLVDALDESGTADAKALLQSYGTHVLRPASPGSDRS